MQRPVYQPPVVEPPGIQPGLSRVVEIVGPTNSEAVAGTVTLSGTAADDFKTPAIFATVAGGNEYLASRAIAFTPAPLGSSRTVKVTFGATVYNDTATGQITLSGTVAEAYSTPPIFTTIPGGTRFVAPTSKAFTATPLGASRSFPIPFPIFIFTDTASGTITLTGSIANEQHGPPVLPTVAGTSGYTTPIVKTFTTAPLGPSRLETITSGTIIYNDTAAGTITLTGTATDDYHRPPLFPQAAQQQTGQRAIAAFTAAPLGQSRAIAVTPPTNIFNDSPAGTITLSGTATQSASFADTVTGTVVLAGTVTESFTTPPIVVRLQGGATSARATVAIQPVPLGASRTLKIVFPGISFNDSPAGTITLSGSASESHTSSATRAGTITLSGTPGETAAHSRTAAGTVTLSGSSSSVQGYNDTPAGTTTLSGTATQSHSSSATVAGTIVLSGTMSEDFHGPQQQESPFGIRRLKRRRWPLTR